MFKNLSGLTQFTSCSRKFKIPSSLTLTLAFNSYAVLPKKVKLITNSGPRYLHSKDEQHFNSIFILPTNAMIV